jgi:hypothetical protein
MARTESTTIQVHPDDEQSQIDLMQKFHWSLLNSQTIDKTDSHLERRGDKIYSVTESTRYVKLAFSREVDLPNLTEVKKLESEYFALKFPEFPKLFPVSIILWLVMAIFYGIGIALWLLYFFVSYSPKKKTADEQLESINRRRNEILNELNKYD